MTTPLNVEVAEEVNAPVLVVLALVVEAFRVVILALLAKRLVITAVRALINDEKNDVVVALVMLALELKRLVEVEFPATRLVILLLVLVLLVVVCRSKPDCCAAV